MHFTDERPFLDAVFDRYADDRPRLVYADFLADAGEPERAELVRVQLALARLPEDDPRRPALADRQAELLARNRAAWTAHLAGLVVSADFRRGVPDSVSADAATFLETGYELFRRARARRLRLLDAAPHAEKLAASPLLERVAELDLCGSDLGRAGVTALAKSPHFKALEALDLGFNGLDDAAVVALARSPAFPELTALALNDNERVTGDGLKALAVASSAPMARLRTFRANGNRIGDAGATALARSALLGRMLAESPVLELRGNAIGPEGARALAVCPHLARCTHLDLSDNYLGDAGIAELLRSPHLGALRVLKLARNQLTDAGVSAARDLFDAHFDRLRALDLSHNRLTRVGLSILSAVRRDRAVRVEVGGNVQSAPAGDAPVAVSDLLPDRFGGMTEAARLRQRVMHPRGPDAPE